MRGACAAVAILVVAGCGTADHGATAWTARDESAVRGVDSAYVTAWIKDDTAGVLATLASEVILMPAGQHPLDGLAEVRAFWWPMDGSRTRILTFDRHIDELIGIGDVAYMRGTDTLTFTYAKGGAPVAMGSRSMTLSVFRRGADGGWRISRMMWGVRGN